MHDLDSDAELMLRVKAGDIAAFESLVRRHQKRVINTVHRFLGRTEDAEDIAQDVFLGLYRSASRYEPTAKFTTYLYRLVANRCIDHSRRGRILRLLGFGAPGGEAEPGRAPVEPASTGPTPAQEALRKETAERVNRAVLALPARQRMAVLLRHYLGMDYGEVGTTLAMSSSAVKSVLHRAMEALRASLKEP